LVVSLPLVEIFVKFFSITEKIVMNCFIINYGLLFCNLFCCACCLICNYIRKQKGMRLVVCEQAMDRAHRIGQTRPVLVFRLATAHSVEGRLLQRANSKLMLERLVIKQVPSFTYACSKCVRTWHPTTNPLCVKE